LYSSLALKDNEVGFKVGKMHHGYSRGAEHVLEELVFVDLDEVVIVGYGAGLAGVRR
jgi:hypothetical protein